MWSACLDEYQHAVGWRYDLVLFGRNRRVLILTQGFLDFLFDLEQGGVQRRGLCGDFGEVGNMGGAAVREYHHARTARGSGGRPRNVHVDDHMLCLQNTSTPKTMTNKPDTHTNSYMLSRVNHF